MKINVIEYLQETVKNYPDKIGFEDASISLSFKQFNFYAQNISTNICNLTSSIQKPIGIFLPKSVNALVAFMGVLYSGNIYMPLDVKNPPERLTGILNHIQPEFIITDKANASKLEQVSYNCKILIFEEIITDIENIKFRYDKLIDTDGAYIINTSGSTGVPKGVLISHKSIIDYIEWATECYNIKDTEIIGNQAPFYFDNSVLDIYLTLKNGCKLVITPESLFIFPIKLMEYFRGKNINMFFFVPSILVNIANMDILKTCKPNFTKILFAGEVMPTKQLNYWIKYYPEALFSNLYGPTEITVDCTYYTVDRKFEDNESLPIGKKCRNSDVIILNDKDEEIIKPNESGELCVRGTSLALGYYNDFEKTNKVFTQNPLNKHYPERIYRTGDMVYYNERGEIIFQGRKDFQIKHMGYRIELGEIETALGTIEALKNVCVVYDQINSKIVLFYESNIEITSRDLVLSLGKIIPKYMIPSDLRKIDKLPINANGKIDRLKLKAMINESELCKA
ncbi:amino acid adenylation domain-containing protein [bacterium]|nr:amino acid adenylation domain-containing protein [bacterium]